MPVWLTAAAAARGSRRLPVGRGLERLRTRLGLSEEAADKQYAKVARTKVKAFGERAVEQLETKAKAQRKEGDDKGGEVMGASLTSEMLALVEYAQGARLLKTTDGGQVCSATLRGQFAETMVKEMYRQCLVEGFSGEGAQNERLFGSLEPLSLVIGLDAPEVAEIHEEIGALIYRQYLGKALKTGGIGDKEEQFLAQIKGVLDLDDAKCDVVVREQKVEYVSNLVNKLFLDPSVEAAAVTKVRDAAALYDVDLVEELEVNSFRLEKMFSVEVEELIDSGELDTGDTSALEEVCESLHVTEERAQEILQVIVQKKAVGGILQASALVRQDRADEMKEELDRMLRFASLLPGAVSTPGVSAELKQEMYMLYQASSLGSEIDEGAKEKTALLKEVMGLQERAAVE